MEVLVDRSFIRDVKKMPEPMQRLVDVIIQSIKKAKKISDIPKIKKLSGAKNAYRIRVEDYRLGFYIENQKLIVLSRFLPRKDIYGYFP